MYSVHTTICFEEKLQGAGSVAFILLVFVLKCGSARAAVQIHVQLLLGEAGVVSGWVLGWGGGGVSPLSLSAWHHGPGGIH